MLVVFVVGRDDSDVRYSVTDATLAVPVAELVGDQFGVLVRAQSIVGRVRIVAEPVPRPIYVRFATPAFSALGLHGILLISNFV